MPDKFSAVWVSHSSLSDFLKCPRGYYLRNVYKDPQSNHKIQLISPPLTLGSAVHEVLEGLSLLPVKTRFNQSIVEKFNQVWEEYSGERGGFFDLDTEHRYKERGLKMLLNVQKDPGPLAELAVKIKNMDLPHYWLSEEDNIILCGKVDWLHYLPDSDSVHIIDFKTNKSEEKPNSLQLPIYLLLVQNIQKRPVSKASYWYLELPNNLVDRPLPDPSQSEKEILDIAKKIKLARQLNKFSCPKNGCIHCLPYEAIIQGKGKLVGVDKLRKDLYVLPHDPGESSFLI